MATRSIDMPVVGLASDAKPAKASFTPTDAFDRLLEVQGGYRVAWSRVLRCPCTPSDALTDTAKPSCPHCKGMGWMMHLPTNYIPPKEFGTLTPLQQSILTDYKAACINGFASDLTRSKKPITDSGDAGEGMFRLTVRPENRLNHYDRVVLLDSLVPFDEARALPAGATILPLRYKVTEVITLVGEDGVALGEGAYQLHTNGTIELASKAKVVRRFACLYNLHPVARVKNHMHLARQNIAAAKKAKKNLLTPQGDPLKLPLQVLAQLEWLVK